MKLNSRIFGIAFAVIVLSLTIATHYCGAVDFRDVYKTAIQLELNVPLTNGEKGIALDLNEADRRVAKAFLKPTKSDLINKHLLTVDAMINDIRSKTLAIYHSVLNNDFGGSIKRAFLLNNIKNYANFDSEISAYTDGLNTKVQAKQLDEEEITCAMENLKSRHQQVVLFVLATEFKHLVLNDIGLINDAILSQLKDQKMQSKNDYFNYLSLNEAQTEALKEFYSTYRDTEVSNAEDYLDHVVDPGQLIIGRLLDSCSSALQIRDQWSRVSKRQEVCPENITVFKTAFLAQKTVDAIQKFCNEFIKV